MTIRVAVLGYGRNGSTMHAGAIEADGRFEMVAVCDIDEERRRQASERFKCPVYADYHEMLAKETLDLVSIVTMSHQHSRMACDCLEAGVNVLVTKPWALDKAEALAMMEAQEHSGKMLLPWLPSRWGCVLRRLRQLVAEGAIGDVFMVRRAVGTFGTRTDWQTESRFGGGYLLNWGAHIVDPPLVLMGSPVVSVYGRMLQTINPGDVEDVFHATLTLADGTVVVAEQAVTALGLPDWVLHGDRGTIEVRGNHLVMVKCTPQRPDDPTQYAGMAAGDPAMEASEEEIPGNQYGDEGEVYSDVAMALIGERPFPVTPAHALSLTETLDAIRASSVGNLVVQMAPGTELQNCLVPLGDSICRGAGGREPQHIESGLCAERVLERSPGEAV